MGLIVDLLVALSHHPIALVLLLVLCYVLS